MSESILWISISKRWFVDEFELIKGTITDVTPAAKTKDTIAITLNLNARLDILFLSCYSFLSITLNLAGLERRLASISLSLGATGFLVTNS